MAPAALEALTVLLAMLVDMEEEGARQVSALVTVRLVGTLLDRLLLGRHGLTAFYVLLVGMEQEAALRVSALVTVLPVGTPPKRLVQVQQRLTALRAMWVLSLMVWAVPASRAALHVPLGGMSM